MRPSPAADAPVVGRTLDYEPNSQAAEEPPHTEFSVDPATVMLAGRVGARIVISVYGAALAKASASITVPAKPRVQPTGRKGAGLRAGGTLRCRL
jgi:hypothetical protein